MIIGNRPKLREDLSHVGFKSPHDFLEKKKQTSQKKTGYSLSDHPINYNPFSFIHIYLHREPSGVKL